MPALVARVMSISRLNFPHLPVIRSETPDNTESHELCYFFSETQGKFTNKSISTFTCSSGISISDSLRKRMR